MSMLDETRFVERLQFFDGMRLFAADLQGIEMFNREMRWMHNRSLHQAGIGKGFAVSGKKGSREVEIGPGYALDSQGREIVLTQTETEEVPPVAGEWEGVPAFYDLTVSYPDDGLLNRAEMRQGVCCPAGAVRLREEPVFCWVRLRENTQAGTVRRKKTPGPAKVEGVLQAEDPKLRQEILDGLRIVLGRIEVLDCQLNRDISLSERRSARPSCQPHLASGLHRGRWKIVPKPFYPYLFQLTMRVDTQDANFRTIPFYEGHIDGKRPLELVVSQERRAYLIDLGMGVRDEQIGSFEAVAVALFAPAWLWEQKLMETIGRGAVPLASLVRAARKTGFGKDRSELEKSLMGNAASPLDAWGVMWMGAEG
jgi:hypothetical protein